MQERILALIFPAVLCAVALAACGGGGGNPGTCSGSAAECVSNGNPNVSTGPSSGITNTPDTSTPSTTSTTTTTGTTTTGTTTTSTGTGTAGSATGGTAIGQ
ncbi:hypothetical protein [Ramlibacter sp.]|uniref:hypothetical protein n=1 Tax=Ramlibacter sp. TaxID=1917967 RepID=UPI002633C346|nr:hypothetical protein [Ramlibacter sp.]MDB5956891.1 hypothetical protein [Ramlibacter sp.]